MLNRYPYTSWTYSFTRKLVYLENSFIIDQENWFLLYTYTLGTNQFLVLSHIVKLYHNIPQGSLQRNMFGCTFYAIVSVCVLCNVQKGLLPNYSGKKEYNSLQWRFAKAYYIETVWEFFRFWINQVTDFHSSVERKIILKGRLCQSHNLSFWFNIDVLDGWKLKFGITQFWKIKILLPNFRWGLSIIWICYSCVLVPILRLWNNLQSFAWKNPQYCHYQYQH